MSAAVREAADATVVSWVRPAPALSRTELEAVKLMVEAAVTSERVRSSTAVAVVIEAAAATVDISIAATCLSSTALDAIRLDALDPYAW